MVLDVNDEWFYSGHWRRSWLHARFLELHVIILVLGSGLRFGLIKYTIAIFFLVLTGPRGLGHTVAGILCVLDWTNVSSIQLTTVGASKRLPSDMYLISCMLYGQL